jgi:hypothetical protein
VSVDTLPMPRDQQPKRRLALALALLALLLTAGGAYVVVNRPPRDQADATATTPTNQATPLFSAVPKVATPTTSPPATAKPSPTPKLSFDDAVERMRRAVENGAAGGQIRGDVAVDLLNFIKPLEFADGKNVDAQVAALRQKIADRAGNGDLSRAQVTILRARLTDLDRAAGM